MVSDVLFIALALIASSPAHDIAVQSPPAEQIQSQEIDTSDARNRLVVAQFARCVIQKHHREAAQLVLSLGVNHYTAPSIADPDCAMGAMSLWPGAFQEALADALVNEEFSTFDPALIAGAPPLKQPVLNESTFAPKPGRTYTSKELQELEQQKAAAPRNFAYWPFGECVVRADPAGAHSLLMTEVASAEEAAAIEQLRPTLVRCIGPDTQMDNAMDVRGSIAINYYRLARCPHDPRSHACDLKN